MPIRVKCPSCQSQMQVPDGSSGKQTRCPHCQTVVRIPEAPTAGAAAPLFPAAPPPPAAAAPPPAAAPSGGGIRIRCPRCSTLLSVPAAAAGKTVRCSSCQTQLRVPGGSASGPATTAGPAGSGGFDFTSTAAPASGGGDLDWDSLGPLPSASAPPAGGYLSPAAAPRTPYRPPAAVRSVGSLPSGREPWHYIVPAAFMLIWGCLLVLAQVVGIGLFIYIVATQGLPPQVNMAELAWRLAGNVIGLTSGLAMALGSIAMIQRTNMGAARSAAVVASIPCIGCLVMPFGIWACVLLFSAAGQRDFE